LGDLDKIISLISGRGLLDIRAWIASVVGPARLPMGAKSTYALAVSAEPTMIATNLAIADAYVFVGIAAENGQPAVASGVLGQEGQLGMNSWPVQFLPFANIYPLTVLLLPGEQLFAKATDIDTRIIISQVTFR
jgi:hypothetical protein